ncbi:MAG: pyridoxal 5'-phosphate synthase glutaminase subunit PdxT [Thermoleophilia bacterium]
MSTSTAATPGRPRIGVLAVQGAFAEHAAALRAVGGDPVEVRAPHDLDGLDGIVLPGGESTTLGLVAEQSGLLARLRELLADGLPALGTCAGMIVLARAVTEGAQPLVGGMDIVVRRNAFGRQRASFEAPVEVPTLGAEPVDAVFIRAPWIERAGPAVEVLATHSGHGVAARQGELMVTAFHPELAGERRFHEWLIERARQRRERGELPAEERGRDRVRAQ